VRSHDDKKPHPPRDLFPKPPPTDPANLVSHLINIEKVVNNIVWHIPETPKGVVLTMDVHPNCVPCL
jgi:hypothetical protein